MKLGLVCAALLLLYTHGWGATAQTPACPVLDARGCCGDRCKLELCSALFWMGTSLGAHNTTGKLVWENRTGWQHLYRSTAGPVSSNKIMASADAGAACTSLQQQSQAQQPPGTSAPLPFFCGLFGVACNATQFNSSCPDPTAAAGVSAIELVNNNLSGNLSSSAFMSSLQLLHDCGLQRLVIGGGYGELRGSLTPQWGRFSSLQVLSIFTTNLTGPLPVAIGNMSALKFLDLAGNYLTGTLPASLGDLSELRYLSLAKNGFTDLGKALDGTLPSSITKLKKLELLSLESNELSGTLPPTMCRDMAGLRAISLRDNNFTGSIAQLASCTLQSLDLSDNQFTGRIPTPLSLDLLSRGPWQRLQKMDLAQNMLTGTLPDFPYGSAPLLSIINVAGNQLTGSLPRSWTFLPWLSQLDVSSNKLSGTLPWDLALQSMLTSLRVHSNVDISGTISPWFRLTVSLRSFTFHNTSINGALPGITRATYQSQGFNATRLCGGEGAGLGRLPSLQQATLSDTHMTAACGASEQECNSIDDFLPWYLSANTNAHGWEVPVPEPGFHDNAFMKCPRITQEKFCRLYRPPEFFPDGMRPTWSLSPSYYHYRDCVCMGGYSASYITKEHGGANISVLVCNRSNQLDPTTAAGITVAVCAVGMLLLAYGGYVSWYGRWGLPKLQRAVADLQKRREGAPKSGRVSIVVTDIQGYTGLMVKMPLAMGQALAQHSNVIRRAAWTHYGFVVGQEGDSFILAFRDACDAVAFCLQVQQGLIKVPWPVELLQHQQKQDLAAAAPLEQQLQGRSRSATAAAAGICELGSSGAPWEPSAFTPGSPTHPYLQRTGTPSGSGSVGQPSTSGLEQQQVQQQMLQRTGSSKGWLAQQQRQQPPKWVAPESVLMPGLRVRIGVASGVLGEEESCLNSKVLETARVVSDIGCGGQVLLDSVTFGTIKHRLEELGQVGSHGYNTSSRVTGWGAPKGWLAKLARRHVQLAAEAVVLDMGLYTLPGVELQPGLDHRCLLPDLPSAASILAATGTGGPTATAATAAAAGVGLAGAAAKQAAAAASTQQGKGTAGGTTTPAAVGCVRLYQILAPKCVVRALLFGNRLALKQGARCHDLPYFCAPAAASRSLLDALLLEGSFSQQPQHPRGHSGSVGRRGGASSRVWLRKQYRLPVAGATLSGAVGSAGRSSSNALAAMAPEQQRAAAAGPPGLVSRSPFSGSTAAASAPFGGPLSPAFSSQQWLQSPPTSRTQSASVVSDRQPPQMHMQQQQQQTQLGLSGARPQDSNVAMGGSPAAAADLFLVGSAATGGATHATAAAAANTTDGGTDSAHGSSKSTATSSGAWPLVSLPLRGLAPLRGGSSDWGPGGTSGVTYVFASAVLPKSYKPDSSAAFACAAGVISTLVRQTLMAFAAAAEAAAAAAEEGDSAGGAAAAGGALGHSASMGYLFRESTAEMKYLLAFHSPKAALEWCLLVQEAMQWQDWPPALLQPSAATKTPEASKDPSRVAGMLAAATAAGTLQASHHHAPAANGQVSAAAAAAAADVSTAGSTAAGAAGATAAKGLATHSRQPLLRGPCMKMGVAAGPPQSVSPDHIGRADYIGSAVNLAARYEAVCAQPGQIVCDAELAEAVMSEWAAAAAAAAAVQEQLQHLSAAAAQEAADAAAPAHQLGVQERQQQPPGHSSSPFAAPAQQLAAATPAMPTGATAAAGGAAPGRQSFEAEPFWQEASLASSAEAASALQEAAAAATEPPVAPLPSFAAPGGASAAAAAPAPAQVSTGSFTSFTVTDRRSTACDSVVVPFGSPAAAGASAAGASPSAADTSNKGSGEGRTGATQMGPPGRTTRTSLESAAAVGPGGHLQQQQQQQQQQHQQQQERRSLQVDISSVPSSGFHGLGGGGFGLYGPLGGVGNSSFRRPLTPQGGSPQGGSPNSSFQHSPSYYHHQHYVTAAQLGPYQQQYLQQEQQQQPRGMKASRSGFLRGSGPLTAAAAAAGASSVAAAAVAPPEPLPLQPPSCTLPCPAAVPDGLPPFELAVECHKLGLYKFKGAAATISMVEVVASSHVTARGPLLVEPSAGPKGGLEERQQGLLQVVEGVQLPGLVHVYRHLHEQRTAAAAAATSAAAALQSLSSGPERTKGVFVGPRARLLRQSLQLPVASTPSQGSHAASVSSTSSPTAKATLARRLSSGMTHASSKTSGSLSGVHRPSAPPA